MVVSHTRDRVMPVASGGRHEETRGFGYYFPDAPVTGFDPHALSAMEDLHRAVVESRSDTERLTSLFTWFGRFLNHDIAGRALSDLTRIENPNLVPAPRAAQRRLRNMRTGRLDLDSLYGPVRPTGNAALDRLLDDMRCPSDRAKMWTVPSGSGLPRLGDLLDSAHSSFTAADVDELPAAFRARLLTRSGEPDRHAAIIGDGRNDLDPSMAELHLAFLQFHNRMVGAWPGKRRPGDADEVHLWARGHVRRMYQWLVLHVYLPGVCDARVIREILADGPRLYDDFLARCGWTEGEALPLPLEFSTGILKFADAIARGSCKSDRILGFGDARVLPDPAFGLILKLASPAPDPVARLNRCFPCSGRADPFTGLPHSAPIRCDPMARDLRRGVLKNLPSGQAVAAGLRELGFRVPVLNCSQLTSGSTGVELEAGRFVDETPLWFYALKEAEVLCKGQRLGPVGSHIFAGTVIGLLLRGPDPVWNAPGSDEGRWHPVDGPGSSMSSGMLTAPLSA